MATEENPDGEVETADWQGVGGGVGGRRGGGRGMGRGIDAVGFEGDASGLQQDAECLGGVGVGTGADIAWDRERRGEDKARSGLRGSTPQRAAESEPGTWSGGGVTAAARTRAKGKPRTMRWRRAEAAARSWRRERSCWRRWSYEQAKLNGDDGTGDPAHGVEDGEFLLGHVE